MPDPTEIAATLLAHGRHKQDRLPGFYPRSYECLADRDERGEAACIVGDAGSLEAQSAARDRDIRSEKHTSELQSRGQLVCRLLLEKKKNKIHSDEVATYR